MLHYHFNGYKTCVHSRKRANAPWKVYDSCPNPGRLPSFKGYELPYPTMCMTCRFYFSDRQATTHSNHFESE